MAFRAAAAGISRRLGSAAGISRRLGSAAAVARLRAASFSTQPPTPPDLNPKEAYLHALCLENAAAIAVLQKENLALRLANVELTESVSKASAAAREAVVQAKTETGRTAWKVVTLAISGFVSTMCIVHAIVESPYFNNSKVTVVLTDAQGKQLMRIFAGESGAAEVESDNELDVNPFMNDLPFDPSFKIGTANVSDPSTKSGATHVSDPSSAKSGAAHVSDPSSAKSGAAHVSDPSSAKTGATLGSDASKTATALLSDPSAKTGTANVSAN